MTGYTPDPALVELAARVLYESEWRDPNEPAWEDLPPADRESYRQAQRPVLSALAAAGRLRQDAEEIQSEEPIPYATTGPEVKPEKAEPHPAVRVVAEILSARLDMERWERDGWPTVDDDLAAAVAPAFLRWIAFRFSDHARKRAASGHPDHLAVASGWNSAAALAGMWADEIADPVDIAEARKARVAAEAIRAYTRTTSTSTFTTPWTVGGATRRSRPQPPSGDNTMIEPRIEPLNLAAWRELLRVADVTEYAAACRWAVPAMLSELERIRAERDDAYGQGRDDEAARCGHHMPARRHERAVIAAAYAWRRGEVGASRALAAAVDDHLAEETTP